MSIIDGKKTLSKQSIPVISNQTLDAVYEVYAGNKWGIHLTELKEKLLTDNPNLVKFIESQVGKYPRELHNAMLEVVMGTIVVICLQGLLDETNGKRGSK
jgi:hypothetical protein